jgi:hypothetical protein
MKSFGRKLESFEKFLKSCLSEVKNRQKSKRGLKKRVKISRVKWACAQKHPIGDKGFGGKLRNVRFWRPVLRSLKEACPRP